jgi:hypothetical protein
MSTPGFNAETSLRQVISANGRQHRKHGVAASSGQPGSVVPQVWKKVTFMVVGGRTGVCYEDTERQMSICEWD